MTQTYEEKIEEALVLYWAHHKSFTQIARITTLSFDTVRDAVLDSIVNHYGFKYRSGHKEEK